MEPNFTYLSFARTAQLAKLFFSSKIFFHQVNKHFSSFKSFQVVAGILHLFFMCIINISD